MPRVAITALLRGEAAEPSGDPPQTDPRASSMSVEAATSDGSPFAVAAISYENHAVFTGPTTFTETGTVRFDDGDGEIDIAAVSDGTLGPSADPELLQGAVFYSVVEGRGRFAGATGLVTSNFLLRPAAGEFEERWVAVVFLP
jgi:hypothetical protein